MEVSKLDKSTIKAQFTAILYGKHDIFEFKEKIYKSTNLPTWLPPFIDEIKRITTNKEYNMDSAAFCTIIQEYESRAIMALYQKVLLDGYKPDALIYDGMLISKENGAITRDTLDSWGHYIHTFLKFSEKSPIKLKLEIKSMPVNEDYLATIEYDF